MRLTAEFAAALLDDAATLALLHHAELPGVVFEELRRLAFPANLALLPVGEASLASYALMRQAIGELPAKLSPQTLDELAADYAAIYLTGALGVSPCESFWLSDDHLVCQEPMFDLRALYASAGLAVADWRKRPDDHLVVQLEFLASRLEDASGDDDWRAIADLLDEHLLLWLGDFARRAASRCDTPFYAALALLTHAWCEQVRELIAAGLGEPRPGSEEIERRRQARHPLAVPAQPLHFVPGAAGPSW